MWMFGSSKCRIAAAHQHISLVATLCAVHVFIHVFLFFALVLP